MDEREEPISLEQVLKDLQAQGVPLTGEEIAEAELRAAWESLPHVTQVGKLQAPVDPSGYQEVNEGPATLPRRYRPIKPIKDSEQMSLFT